MVEENSSGSYMQIVWSPTGWKVAYMNGQTLEQGNFSLPAGAVVAYNSSGLLTYHHADWLGSYRLASTPTRTVYWAGAYAPFGEPYAPSGGGVDLSFTGQNQDTSANVYDFPGREYGIQGRWPSPDPAGIAAVDPTDPQTWNRYAYVRNSPLTMTDPTGLDGNNNCDSYATCGPGDPGAPSFCGWDPCGTGLPPDLPIPVMTQMGGFGPGTFTPPGSNSIFACNPYQSCPGVYVPNIDYSWMSLLNWGLGLPDPCSDWYVGCVNDATPSIQQRLKDWLAQHPKVKWYVCGENARGALREYLVGGAIKGAVIGGVVGGVSTEGPGVIPGAAGGAIVGASGGSLVAPFAIAACSALGEYD